MWELTFSKIPDSFSSRSDFFYTLKCEEPVNVAELTTGNAGRFSHNFIPNVIAELGLVGLILVLTLLLISFAVLIKNIKQAPTSPEGFGTAVINFWIVFMLIWLFLYANISAGKSWPVMWFFIGFAVNVFVFDKGRNVVVKFLSAERHNGAKV